MSFHNYTKKKSTSEFIATNDTVIMQKSSNQEKRAKDQWSWKKVINIVYNIIGGVHKENNPRKSNGNQALKAPPQYGCGRNSCLTQIFCDL